VLFVDWRKRHGGGPRAADRLRGDATGLLGTRVSQRWRRESDVERCLTTDRRLKMLVMEPKADTFYLVPDRRTGLDFLAIKLIYSPWH
jgi:hypothetical protein